jgi:hypothetical protein
MHHTFRVRMEFIEENGLLKIKFEFYYKSHFSLVCAGYSCCPFIFILLANSANTATRDFKLF